jgi:hypothetical protein
MMKIAKQTNFVKYEVKMNLIRNIRNDSFYEHLRRSGCINTGLRKTLQKL